MNVKLIIIQKQHHEHGYADECSQMNLRDFIPVICQKYAEFFFLNVMLILSFLNTVAYITDDLYSWLSILSKSGIRQHCYPGIFVCTNCVHCIDYYLFAFYFHYYVKGKAFLGIWRGTISIKYIIIVIITLSPGIQ